MTAERQRTRCERDQLGTVQVPADALYGAQTQRAIANFPRGASKVIGDFPTLIEGMMFVKAASARVNGIHGFITQEQARAIAQAAGRVREESLFAAFPVHHLHGGGGTSANMNANEVLANMAEEQLGGRRGDYRLVHPNDHVNRHQSTNDVYPTACHIAILRQWPRLRTALDRLCACIERKAEQLRGQRRIARTCLQDAVAVSFEDLFGGYASALRRGASRADQAVAALYVVPLGGTIVGRSCDVPQAYLQQIVPELCYVTDDPGYQQNRNLFDGAQNIDDMASVSAAIELLAGTLIKIASDLRLMNSGPEAGFGEISLPAMQPGSSIMPGKVNPVIPEFVMQVCFKVVGHNATCQLCLRHGELDLNVWESAAVFSVLESMQMLEDAVRSLDEKCIAGLQAHAEVNARHAATIIPTLTRLMHRHGYSVLSETCRQSEGDIERLRQLIAERYGE